MYLSWEPYKQRKQPQRANTMKTVRKNAKKKIQEIINKAVFIKVFEQGEMTDRMEAVTAKELKEVISTPSNYDGLEISDNEDGSFSFTIIRRCWNYTVYHNWEAAEASLAPEAYNEYRSQAA